MKYFVVFQGEDIGKHNEVICILCRNSLAMSVYYHFEHYAVNRRSSQVTSPRQTTLIRGVLIGFNNCAKIRNNCVTIAECYRIDVPILEVSIRNGALYRERATQRKEKGNGILTFPSDNEILLVQLRENVLQLFPQIYEVPRDTGIQAKSTHLRAFVQFFVYQVYLEAQLVVHLVALLSLAITLLCVPEK